MSMRQAKRMKYRAMYQRLFHFGLTEDDWEDIWLDQQIRDDCARYYYNDLAGWQTEQMYY